MRFVHLSPGAGESFYCENCIRDTELIVALRREGHEAHSVPLYLPPMVLPDSAGPHERMQVFFGGINVYLQQHFAFFRRTPRWLDRLFDAPWLLRWAGRRSSMTRAADVAATMISMLRGEHGRQVKELERLVAWLAENAHPDVVSLSNALLMGLVRRTKQALGVPVICSLQDEEGYVEALPPTCRRDVWDMLARRAADVDAFIAPSAFYRDEMRRRLGLDDGRIHVIHDAIDPGELAPAERPPAAPTIGFLSQMCAGKGLDTLVEAFIRLRRSGRHGGLRLAVFGGVTGADEAFVRQQRQRLREEGLAGEVTFPDRFDPAEKREFLHSCSVISVPTREGEAFGIFVLEALACGIPVVLPEHGAFPELIAATGGGLLCRPNDPAALARTLERLLSDPRRAEEMGRRGRQAVTERFNNRRMAAEVAALCEGLLAAAET